MAFSNKIGNLLKKAVSSSPSVFQSIRCMSSSKVFVGGLSYGTDDHSLKDAFNGYGEVVEARVIIDRETGRSRGFGFVTFNSTEEASAAINGLDGQELHGRNVRVNYATDRPPRTGFGGGDGGYGGGGGFGGRGGGGYGGGGQGGYGGGGQGGYGSGQGGYGGGVQGGYGGGGQGGYGGGGGGYGGGGYGRRDVGTGGGYGGGNYGESGGYGGKSAGFGGVASGFGETGGYGGKSTGFDGGDISAESFFGDDKVGGVQSEGFGEGKDEEVLGGFKDVDVDGLVEDGIKENNGLDVDDDVSNDYADKRS